MVEGSRKLKIMKNELGTRMKEQYEDRTRYALPRRIFTILRLDGKAFHTYTRGMNKPFDEYLTSALNDAAIKLCNEAQGVKFAYLQSDEISVLLQDFDNPATEAWFDGNIQKICSVSSSIVTRSFCLARIRDNKDDGANFDARVFCIADPEEVANYFIWRQLDCIRNAIMSIARQLYSHKELKGKNQKELVEMIGKRAKSVDDYPCEHIHGRIIWRKSAVVDEAVRSKWIATGAFNFIVEREALMALINTKREIIDGRDCQEKGENSR